MVTARVEEWDEAIQLAILKQQTEQYLDEDDYKELDFDQ